MLIDVRAALRALAGCNRAAVLQALCGGTGSHFPQLSGFAGRWKSCISRVISIHADRLLK